MTELELKTIRDIGEDVLTTLPVVPTDGRMRFEARPLAGHQWSDEQYLDRCLRFMIIPHSTMRIDQQDQLLSSYSGEKCAYREISVDQEVTAHGARAVRDLINRGGSVAEVKVSIGRERSGHLAPGIFEYFRDDEFPSLFRSEYMLREAECTLGLQHLDYMRERMAFAEMSYKREAGVSTLRIFTWNNAASKRTLEDVVGEKSARKLATWIDELKERYEAAA